MHYTRQHDFTYGTTIDAEQVDGEFNAIRNILNGNIDSSNINSQTFGLIAYPVGSIYISINNVNPSALFGGIWEAFATGRTIVGIDPTQTEFDTASETGGGKTHSHSGVSGNENQNHTHGYTSVYRPGAAAVPTGSYYAHFEATAANTGGMSNSHTHNFSVGSGVADSTLQPYTVVYMWKRTS